MARRLAIGSVQLSDRAPRIVAAGGEAELEALATAGGADLVELRADLCEEPRPETLPALLARLRAGGRPLILTTRAATEGGRPMDDARRRALYTSGLPHADAIDVEIASTALAAELVPQARAAGKTVVLSAHVLHSTPPAAALLGLIDRAEALGADVTKLVTHARDLDALRSACSSLSARFAASSFSFARRERRRFWRRMRVRSARAASATPRLRASSLSSRSRRARKRFRACERSR